MPLPKGHAPIHLMEPYLEAVRQKDKEALFEIWDNNRGYGWKKFTEWLTDDERRWMGYAHQDWLRKEY